MDHTASVECIYSSTKHTEDIQLSQDGFNLEWATFGTALVP